MLSLRQGSRIHFISIGGSVMHNLAIELQHKGFEVTGSDDEIYEPSASRLKAAGLLPGETGWFPEKISEALDAVILGMHARADNPELEKARQIGLPVWSYPQLVYEHSRDRQRVVIAGSHGKTTITAMILHVLRVAGRKFNFVVGAALEGFERSVRLDHDSPVIVIEGDEYLSAPTDPTPKFLHYQPHIAVISGVAWDHFNVYPTWESYVGAFERLRDILPKAGRLFFDETDAVLSTLCRHLPEGVTGSAYHAHDFFIRRGVTFLKTSVSGEVPLHVFGKHTMKNISAAHAVCTALGVTDERFYAAIATFKGAARRLECMASRLDFLFYRDFAHAPSKVAATTSALKDQFPERKLVACTELHTFSSLNKDFLDQYAHTMDPADEAIVFYSPHTLAQKRLPPISADDLRRAFAREKELLVFTDSRELREYLLRRRWHGANLLMMSSGTFGGLDLAELAEEIGE